MCPQCAHTMIAMRAGRMTVALSGQDSWALCALIRKVPPAPQECMATCFPREVQGMDMSTMNISLPVELKRFVDE